METSQAQRVGKFASGIGLIALCVLGCLLTFFILVLPSFQALTASPTDHAAQRGGRSLAASMWLCGWWVIAVWAGVKLSLFGIQRMREAARNEPGARAVRKAKEAEWRRRVALERGVDPSTPGRRRR